tara:strand:+ start:3329 stop:3955 length:627 start_codon:yes stop_codon:yes gene_type:complete
MKKFLSLSGPAAALDKINVDTDQIIPKQYLTAITKSGLGKGLFHDFRYDINDNIRKDFVLNQQPWTQAKILISGENFGCGSSREHAPWSLSDFGIRCVIAPSFADIFFNNCGKNGILLISLPNEKVQILMSHAKNPSSCEMTIDLNMQKISYAESEIMEFHLDESLKYRLLNGLDDIEMTLQNSNSIDMFERNQKKSLPWLYNRETSH